MRRLFAVVLLCCLAATPFGLGSPVDTTFAEGQKLQPNEPWKTTRTFRGGERACVMVIGDVDTPVANLEVSIFDGKGNLVARDKGTEALGADFVCTIWYPPRDGEYRIEVRNPSQTMKSCWLAVK